MPSYYMFNLEANPSAFNLDSLQTSLLVKTVCYGSQTVKTIPDIFSGCLFAVVAQQRSMQEFSTGRDKKETRAEKPRPSTL